MKTRIILFITLVSFVILMAFVSCKKNEVIETPVPQTDSILDVDNNYITVVKIGEQWWTAEDLMVTHYRDNSAIALLDQPAEWASRAAGYAKSNNRTSGYYYNKAAVNHPSQLAPAGWHIATEEDWKKLETYLGMSETEITQIGWRGNILAGKLKVASPKGWPAYQNVWSKNESGFSALPSGCVLPTNETSSNSKTGFWWSATASDSSFYYRYLDYKNNSIFREKTYMNYGMCVRCVKD